MFGTKRSERKPLSTIASIGTGATLMYFFDPQRGRTRRAKLADKFVKLANRGTGKAEQTGRYVGARAHGLTQRVKHAGSGEPPPSDEALADKIRSEVLTRHQYPRGQLNVSVAGGIAELRGTLEDRKAIAALEQEVRKLSGVLDVRNLIHLPDEPAPNIQDALAAQERARRS
jgi:osmotically-inducible protein OsmY